MQDNRMVLTLVKHSLTDSDKTFLLTLDLIELKQKLKIDFNDLHDSFKRKPKSILSFC